jgi:hypothetical protein
MSNARGAARRHDRPARAASRLASTAPWGSRAATARVTSRLASNARAWLVAWLVPTLGLVPACDRNGAATTPSRVPGDGAGLVPGVPYPIADGERIEGAGRAALARASFVLVALGGPPDDRDHALPERIAWDGGSPILVAHHVEPLGAGARSWQPLRRLGFGREEPVRGRAVPVDAAEVEALGFQPPATVVWLVGPRGLCRTEVGGPVVAVYDGAEDTVMVGYQLVGCSGRQWAQVGIVSDSIPVDFRWVPASAAPDVVLAHGRAWDDPLAALVAAPAWSHQDDPRFDLVRLREIPGASPRVLQAHHAWLSALPEDHDGPWCEIDVAWARTDGWYNGRWVDAVPFTNEAVGPFMLGAFVNGTQVDAVLYEDRLDGLVVIPPGPLDDVDDPAAWRQVFVPTGSHDPATLAAWGVEPARGPLPVGPACERVEPAP